MSVDRIISVESGGNPYAKNPRSTATGAGQFLESTWLNTIGKYRPDLVQGLDRQQILALRNDPALSKEMTAAYAKENQGILSSAGVPVNDGNTYLAHFAGPQGAIKVLQADPNAPVGGILGDKMVAANPFLANMTAGDLIGWAGKKMGGAPQQPAAAPAPDMADWYSPQGKTAAPDMGSGWYPQQQPQGVLPAATAQAPAAPSILGNFTPSGGGGLGKMAALNTPPPEMADPTPLLMQPLKRFRGPATGLFNRAY